MSLDVLIADTDGQLVQPTAAKILELEKEGKLANAVHVRLAMLEELTAFGKFGELAPRVVGQTSTAQRTMPNFSDINAGTTVQATCRVEENGDVLIQVSVDRSRIAKGKDAEVGSSEPRRVETLSSQSTIRAKFGAPVLLTSGPTSAESAANCWIVVTVTDK
jgi:hypothetical protein